MPVANLLFEPPKKSLLFRCSDNGCYCMRPSHGLKYFPLKKINPLYNVEVEIAVLGSLKVLTDNTYDLYAKDYYLSMLEKAVFAKKITHVLLTNHQGCLMYIDNVKNFSPEEEKDLHKFEILKAKNFVQQCIKKTFPNVMVLGFYLNNQKEFEPADVETAGFHSIIERDGF